ncbi:MAG: hydroxyisourate hydrolase [Bacteroidetes bacterium]|nr:hydroxyisourate hydrolase [Bacteroidota bacterium]
MSQLTTHILDTSKGKPAEGISVLLEKPGPKGKWLAFAKGISNKDGRIADLLKKDQTLKTGKYRLTFETLSYFSKQDIKCFYPLVQIVFEVTDASHYHVPLLLSPYGYSTYRGS